MLTICQLGNFRPPASSENHWRITFEEMGLKVLPVQEDEANLIDILSACRDADIFIWTRTMGFLKCNGYEMLARIKIPTVALHLDLYIGLERENTISYDPFWRAKFTFTADGDPEHAKKFRELGVNHFWLNPAVIKRECYLGTPREPLKCDVAFIGSRGYHHEHYRGSLIDFLEATYGSRFRLFGANGDSWRGDDLNQLYASVKVAVGDSCFADKLQRYTSDRFFESTGRGACTAFPRIEGISQNFEDGVHLRYYQPGDFADLKRVIDDMLTMTDEQRTAMRRAASNHVRENHTYHNRMSELLNVVARHEPSIAEKLREAA